MCGVCYLRWNSTLGQVNRSNFRKTDQSSVMMRNVVICSIVLYIGMLGAHVVGEDSDSQGLTAKPAQLATEVGHNATFKCKLTLNKENTTVDQLVWFSPNGSVVASDGRVSNHNGTLIVTNARMGDKGQYRCSSSTNYTAEVLLKVYVMPTYFIEGMIVLGVNCFLLLIFFICVAYRACTTKKEYEYSKPPVDLSNH